MSTIDRPNTSSLATASREPLASRIAQTSTAFSTDDLSQAMIDKVKTCLMDFIGCAYESRDLPWSLQAMAIAESNKGSGAAIVGSAIAATYGDAAFANAVMGHGLVREDMHSGSISHLGIAVLPVLLALAQYRRINGYAFLLATVVGYEVGGRVGRALMDADIARIHRPTGITGPVAAAMAGAKMLALSEEAATSALALGANTTLGFNQWAYTGGSEMFFHAGFIARNAVAAVMLAQHGAFASPSALDGAAGLFASLRKRESAAAVELFQGTPEILWVYHKRVPACNFAQTPVQAVLQLLRETPIVAENIAAIHVRVPRAGALYPGCDFSGPFTQILQAKMSIQYNIAAALIEGDVSELNFTLLNHPLLHRLLSLTTLAIDDDFTKVYPGQQGAEVIVTEIGGTVHRARLDDVVMASADEVRTRFRVATAAAMGSTRSAEIEHFIENLEHSTDVGQLGALLSKAVT